MTTEDTPEIRRYRRFETTPIRIAVRVGSVRMTYGRLCSLSPGDVVELEQRVGRPFELLAEGLPIGLVEPVGSRSSLRLKLIGAVEAGDE